MEYTDGDRLLTSDFTLFDVKSDNFDVIIQIENENVLKSGILKVINIGSADEIINLREKYLFTDIFCVVSLFMMFLYFASISIQRKEYNSSFLLAMYCLLNFIFLALADDMIILKMFPNLSMDDLFKIALIFQMFSSYLLLRYVKFNYFIDISKKILKLYELLTIIYAFIILFTPLSRTIDLGRIQAVPGSFLLLYFLYCLIKSLIQKHEDLKTKFLVLFSIICLAFIAVYNTYNQKQLSSLYIIYMLTFVISQGVVISNRYHNSVKTIEDLSNKLKILDKRKDEFLEKTSHELKLPLQGIVNIAKSLMDGVAGNLNSNQRENVEMIWNIGEKLDVLVDDIQDYSNITNGYVIKEEKPVNIKSQLIFAINIASYTIKDKPIVIENRVKGSSAIILGDDKRVRQIFYNLIDTLLIYTLRGKIIVSLYISNQEVIVDIINEELFIDEKDDIFNGVKWINDENAIFHKKKHSDIGLFVAKELTKLHGGDIKFKSSKEEGSKFSVILPIANNLGSEVISYEEKSSYLMIEDIKHANIPLGDNSILLLEPNLINRKVITNSLLIDGYDVNNLASVKDFIEVLDKGTKEDLLIINSILPYISGCELITEVRKKYNKMDLPILIIVDRSYSENVSLALDLGVNDIIVEPYDMNVFRMRVNNLIKLKESFNALINSEMDFLKAQIKPHFIFNVLSVISSMITRDTKKAKKILLDFSDYLRYSFDFSSGESFTPIKKEIDLVKTYVAIEKERFGDRLNIEYNIDENIDIKIPSLVIQPIVENAIRHGILSKIDGGNIELSIYKDGEEVIIRVKDDGVGIESHRLANLLDGKDEKAGVGVKNINSRLIKSYGSGLNIVSNLNQGTEIIIRVPLGDFRV
ncbi:Sensor histidine kinase YpdA [compost metagenome]